MFQITHKNITSPLGNKNRAQSPKDKNKANNFPKTFDEYFTSSLQNEYNIMNIKLLQ